MAGTSTKCEELHAICKPPTGFDPSTACVCSGQQEAAKNASSGKAGNDPWAGNEGAFCAGWPRRYASRSSDAGDWCFVSARQLCHRELMSEYKDVLGHLTASGGPCTSEVESRSSLVLDGMAAMTLPIVAALILAAVLLMTACCGALVHDLWHQKPEAPVAPKETALDLAFWAAQAYAAQNLEYSTPEVVKLSLYGFYQQAVHGDVTGRAPADFDVSGRARHLAWAKHRGMPRERAMEAYINAVNLIRFG